MQGKVSTFKRHGRVQGHLVCLHFFWTYSFVHSKHSWFLSKLPKVFIKGNDNEHISKANNNINIGNNDDITNTHNDDDSDNDNNVDKC